MEAFWGSKHEKNSKRASFLDMKNVIQTFSFLALVEMLIDGYKMLYYSVGITEHRLINFRCQLLKKRNLMN